ncbi:pre-peptidase C-terminal domain-containing protein [Pleionea litopenaei]|uniref:Pre-peptidase C-terminal domain-containing protein n=1 Tax=Pleionea litopenaei TaxID=3070815 RepID=A0AA51RT32_9GAMM|nr:pre-peptidase C-terminal domain-containing protein [Pleionea sp. HL-JVS1]WMS87132.1 pre-peptidase C-terminal domain-containing protein [Pleionea sp. HL-JVS1]
MRNSNLIQSVGAIALFFASQLSYSVEESDGHLNHQSLANNSQQNLKPQVQKIANHVILKAVIADPISMKQMNRVAFDDHGSTRIKIHRPNASFIQVHFNKLHLPPNAYIEVKDPSSTQVHRYGDGQTSLYTLKNGDDGTSSFSALSIFGETVIVEVKISQTDDQKNAQRYVAEVDSIMEGIPENQLDEQWNPLEYEPESTCGVNERRDVQCWADSHPIEFERSRPVARLLINGSASCTAWRVGPDNRMFTNNHCISSATGPSRTEVWFNYQKTGCNSGSTPNRVIVTGDQLLSTSADLDYTLFTLKNFQQVESFGYYGLDVRAPTAQERIYIPQHGRGQPKQLAIESDQNTDGLCRVDVVLADGSAPDTDMGYMCDTIGGSSGSPVIAAASHKALALHHFGGCPNQGVLMNLIWPNVSEHFGGVIPDGDNTPPTGSEPNANFNAEVNGYNVQFTDLSNDADGQIVSRQWQFGDGESSTQKDPSHQYSNAGDYSVVLKVIDNDGNQAQATKIVSISNLPNEGLEKGVAITNLQADRYEELNFFIDLPSDSRNLTFNLSGGSGDADLYVKYAQAPTTSDYDCRPYRSENTESCSYSRASAGRYHVMIRAYQSFSGTQLIADYQESVDGVGFVESNISDTQGGWKHYELDLPSGLATLRAVMSEGSGDADLYVRFGAQPTTSSYDCRPYRNGNNEQCDFTNPQSGIWYFSIRAYSTYSGTNLEVSGE